MLSNRAIASNGPSANGLSANGRTAALRLVIPSDGELYEPTLSYLGSCGMSVRRPNARQYTATITSLPGVEVLFQRSADVTTKVEEGSAELGITGLDRYLEYRTDERQVVSLIDDLGYGRCDFVLAVPDAWLDVSSIDDLADLALEFRQQGKQLRIATKYPKLLREYLFRRGINYFTLVAVSGALEAAPVAGYADLIADLTASGTTLRENRLKTLEGGTILSSQSCLIGNTTTLVAVHGSPAVGPRVCRNVGIPHAGRTLLPPHRQRARRFPGGGQRHRPQPPRGFRAARPHHCPGL